MKRASDSLPRSNFPLKLVKMHLESRQVPEIKGSQGAFIAVVVTLSVLIIICCIAVFYLLRHHEPTEQERAVRRERSQYQTQVANTASGSTLGTLGGKMKQLWRSTSGSKRSGQGGRSVFGRGRAGRGWIRAGSDDEWASRSDHEDDPELGDAPRPPPARDPKSDVGVGVGGVRGEDGVHVVESPQSDAGSGFMRSPYDPDAYAYGDPFSKTAASDGLGALRRSQSPLSSPSSSPSMDEDHEVHSPGGDYRHRSTVSNVSVWTHAGSKFIEDI